MVILALCKVNNLQCMRSREICIISFSVHDSTIYPRRNIYQFLSKSQFKLQTNILYALVYKPFYPFIAQFIPRFILLVNYVHITSLLVEQTSHSSRTVKLNLTTVKVPVGWSRVRQADLIAEMTLTNISAETRSVC